MNYPSIDRLAELQQLIVDFSKVERVTPMGDAGHMENDVEHSFGLAITCWYLQPNIAPELDLLKIFKYALAHDIVEIHAGDTYAFDQAAIAAKDEKERSAINKIKKDWSDFPELSESAESYMDKINEEVKFVKAVDKMLPVLMIELGLSDKNVWAERGITLQMEQENKVSMYVSEYIRPYYDKLITWLDQRGNIPKN